MVYEIGSIFDFVCVCVCIGMYGMYVFDKQRQADRTKNDFTI